MTSLPKLEPLRVSYPGPAGLPTHGSREIFRGNMIIPMKPHMVCKTAERWNMPGTRMYSSLPGFVLGHPFDESKPRKGRWGEILGSTISNDSAWIENELETLKIHKNVREEIAMNEARKDLQKRIEICLYGKPRDPPVPERCTVGKEGFVTSQPQTKKMQPINMDQSFSGALPPNTPPGLTRTVIENEPSCPPSSPESPHQAKCGREYQFRYDDGYSAKIGAVRTPLVMRQPANDGEFLFRHPPPPLQRPLRLLPRRQQQWWPDVCVRYCYPEKPAPRPLYTGLHCDPTVCLPNTTIVKHF